MPIVLRVLVPGHQPFRFGDKEASPFPLSKLSAALMLSGLFPAASFRKVTGQLAESTCFGIILAYFCVPSPEKCCLSTVIGDPCFSRKCFNATTSIQ